MISCRLCHLLLVWGVILTAAYTAAGQQHASKQDTLPTVSANISATPYWDKRWKDGGCVAPGRRLYSSRLWGFSGSGVDACFKQGVKWADGTVFPQPMRCYQQSSGAVLGDIWAQDKACLATWGSFQDAGCFSTGYRQFVAPIQNIPNTSQDKMSWCVNTRALVQSVTFNAPNRCVKSTSNSNVYGYFYVADACCQTPGRASQHGRASQRPTQLQGLCLPPGHYGLPLPEPKGKVPFDLVGPTSTDEQLMQFLAFLFDGGALRVFWQQGGLFYGGLRQVALYAEKYGPPGMKQLNIMDLNGKSPGDAGLPDDWPYQLVDALVVPQVEASDTVVQQEAPSTLANKDSTTPRYFISRNAAGKGAGYFSLPFPTGAAEQKPRLIVTPIFTGCTFVIGVAYGQVHMAHIQPRQTPQAGYDFLADRSSLSQLLHDRGAFGGFTLSEMGKQNVFTFGGDALHGYGKRDRGFLIGVVTSWTIFFLIRIGVEHSVVLIDASDLACRYRLTPPDLPQPGQAAKSPPQVPFDLRNCPAGGMAVKCSDVEPGNWDTKDDQSSAPLRMASFFANTSHVKQGSCIKLSVEVTAGTGAVVFGFVNGVDQERCVRTGGTRSGLQTAQMEFAKIDPEKLYEFRVRSTDGADIAGTATLSSC